MKLLEQFAAATRTKILLSQADLDTKDKVMDEMLLWCREQANIVVLKSATILSCDPTSRTVQNCKSLLLSKGIHPGQVYAATQTFISLLLASGHEEVIIKKQKGEATATFSDQQRHLRDLVYEAVQQGVSDIHIQVRETYAKIRMRQHGELRLYAEWSERLGREIASVAFNKETDHATSHFNPLVPQDASMPLKIQGKDIRLRLASVPAHGGFDMVMRILATGEERLKTLQELGYTSQQVEIIQTAIKLPFGAIIVAGPTGSGKTTTLASCMELVEPTQKLYSIEDPVEKVVEAATQVPVNTEKEDLSFASMGRAALRMDPDVIILGEMRDEDTAHVMVRASITGHLVLTTLHTNRATAIITRLVDMGVSPILLSDSSVLRCLICQRLLPKICQFCAIPLRDSPRHQLSIPAWEAALGADTINSAKARGVGCEKCNRSGVSGRTVVAEVIWVDEVGRQFIQKGDTLGWEKYLLENNWLDFHGRAVQLIREGICDPFDAEKVVGPINASTTAVTYKYQ
jgi:type II secretory ATPase GspE/PulE/Tfp pilus assembly ATPase PilB-like protein